VDLLFIYYMKNYIKIFFFGIFLSFCSIKSFAIVLWQPYWGDTTRRFLTAQAAANEFANAVNASGPPECGSAAVWKIIDYNGAFDAFFRCSKWEYQRDQYNGYAAGLEDGKPYLYDPACSATSENLIACMFHLQKKVSRKNIGRGSCNCEKGDPINGGTGNLRETETDYAGSGSNSLHLTRTYNSQSLRNSRFGANWADAFQRLVLTSPDYPNDAAVRRADGKEIFFTLTNGVYVSDADVTDRLAAARDGTGKVTSWQYLVGADQSKENYDANGRLTSIVFRNGVVWTLSYSSASTAAIVAPTAGLLLSVTDNFGYVLNFSYDSNRRISRMTDAKGQLYQYAYDRDNNLISVTYPDSAVRTYVYNEAIYTENASLPHALTGLIDEAQIRLSTWRYDAKGNAISSEHADGIDRHAFVFNTLGTQTTITDPLGTATVYTYQTIQDTLRNTGFSQMPGAGSVAASVSFQYDANGNNIKSIDQKGNITTHSYDTTRNLETSRTEAYGTVTARTMSTSWHPVYRLPVKIAEPLLLMTFTYDTAGNLLSRTEQATTDTTGAAGLSPTTSGPSRTWRWTYNNVGQILTATSPRTDVVEKTTFTHDTSGNLTTIVDARNKTTQLSLYDANGRAGRIAWPTGATTDLTWDARGWLTQIMDTASSVVRTTRYTYAPTGLLTDVMAFDGSAIHYSYDAAHRLTGISDSLGNRISYALDNKGNRIADKSSDPQGSLKRQITRSVDALGRIQQVTGAAQ